MSHMFLANIQSTKSMRPTNSSRGRKKAVLRTLPTLQEHEPHGSCGDDDDHHHHDGNDDLLQYHHNKHDQHMAMPELDASSSSSSSTDEDAASLASAHSHHHQQPPLPPVLLLTSIQSYLHAVGLPHHVLPHNDVSCVVSLVLTSGQCAAAATTQYKTLIHIHEQQRRVQFHIVSPDLVPDNRRMAVAQYLMNLNGTLGMNWGMGAFELDFTTGELRFRHGMDLQDGILTPKMIHSLLMMPAMTMDRFLPDIQQKYKKR